MSAKELPVIDEVKTKLDVYFSVVVEERKKTTLNKVNAAKTKVRGEITDMSNRLKEARETIQKFQQELRVLEGGAAQPAPV